MLERGRSSLSDVELLSVLLRTGSGKDNAVDLARKLLGNFSGRLCSLGNATETDMQEVDGIGPGKALCIEAAFELGRRFFQESNSSGRNPITRPEQIFRMMLPRLKGLDHEECWAVFLNQSHYPLETKKISSGGTDSTIIDIKLILKAALDCLASHIILVHNHPSGNPRPSKADLRMTESLHDGASSMDIALMDHIIVCDGSFYSFADERMWSPDPF